MDCDAIFHTSFASCSAVLEFCSQKIPSCHRCSQMNIHTNSFTRWTRRRDLPKQEMLLSIKCPAEVHETTVKLVQHCLHICIFQMLHTLTSFLYRHRCMSILGASYSQNEKTTTATACVHAFLTLQRINLDITISLCLCVVSP